MFLTENTRRLLSIAGIGLALLSTSGCSRDWWFGNKDKKPLTGTRIPIFVAPENGEGKEGNTQVITLPEPISIDHWYGSNDQNTGAVQHLNFASSPRLVTKETFGAPLPEGLAYDTAPVMTTDFIYVMDGEGFVYALDTKKYKERWRYKPFDKKTRKDIIGGGLAFSNGTVLVTTGSEMIVALDASTGKELWKRQLGSIARAAPTINNDAAYILTIDNRLYALSMDDGSILFTNEGAEETLAMYGSASPAIEQGVLVVPHSTGEVMGLDPEDGHVLWSNEISDSKGYSTGLIASDIDSLPLIFKEKVYVHSKGGKLAAYGLNDGNVLWERDVQLDSDLWLAGNVIYAISTSHQLLALDTSNGRMIWSVNLPIYETKRFKSREVIHWSSPLLAGGRLWIVGTHGVLKSLDPTNGKTLGNIDIPSNISIRPIIVDGRMVMVSNDGRIVVLK